MKPAMHIKRQPLSSYLFLLALLPATTLAQSSDEEELAQAYGDEPVVSIATGRAQAISRAPAVATVITARDIDAMGATDLDQVLESVPGLHVSVNTAAYNPIYSFRGIFTGYNPQVLMLVNGIPITNVFLGNRSQVWGGMPLENVARIEVIRGPGSALYGADAFAGVINIITKRADDIGGSELGARGGSFATRDGWLQHGSRHGDLEASVYLRAGHSDGHKEVITADAQTWLDRNVFPGSPPASLAPGPVSMSRDSLDARTDLAYGAWRLRAAYQEREVGLGAGLAESLDPVGRGNGRRLYVDLGYERANWLPGWDVSAVAGYNDIVEKRGNPPYMLFPRGAFGGAFPDGVIGNPGHSERHTHASASAFYSGFEKHRLRVGAGYRLEDLYETTEERNFRLVTPGPVFVPLGGLVDVTGTPDVYLTPHERELTYVFGQDEWSLAKDWVLTAGLRHDHYSDFGDTTNPRLALVWDAAYNIVVKALHGRAFRAPSIAEQYNINNPVSLGNPALEPETIVTNELAFSWQPAGALQADLTLFRYHWRDIIRFVENPVPFTGYTAQNAGDQTGKGLELEAAWDATRSLRVAASVSLQRSTDGLTRQAAGLAPQLRGFTRIDWRFAPQWQFGSTVNHVADRERQPVDTRPPLADYTTLDLVLRREKLPGNGDASVSLRNAFDSDAREPSQAPGNIPGDLPLAGRAVIAQLRYRL
jgi:iron complex outermembrane receptor protein